MHRLAPGELESGQWCLAASASQGPSDHHPPVLLAKTDLLIELAII